jgi:hypothetical protein
VGAGRLTTSGVVVTVVDLAMVVDPAGWLPVEEKEDEPVAADAAIGGTADAAIGGTGGTQISATDLEQVARTRVFFGHQSVGRNILDAVPAVFSAHGVQAPPIEQRRTATEASGGYIAEALIGENTKPLQKIQDFDAVMRSRPGLEVDVAVVKLCYIDIVPGTEVDAVFTAYRESMAALERDFPHITFVKATVPLTTRLSTLTKLKQRLRGNDDAYGAAANARRERLNELIRKEYGGDDLFDLAAVESTAPDGSRVSGRHQGQPYFALYDGYASDVGHLNAEGSRRVATAWLAAIARASTKLSP